MEFLDKVLEVITANAVPAGIVLGVLFAIAKAFSNEKAGPVVAKIQKIVDLVAVAALKIGQIAQKISEILAGVIKSDGFLGKK